MPDSLLTPIPKHGPRVVTRIYHMNLRELLLAHLRDPNYKPANEFELSSRLGLNKKQRAMLAHEVRLALKSGNYLRAANGRISPRGANAEQPSTPEKRPVFTPTRRGPGFPVTPTPERRLEKVLVEDVVDCSAPVPAYRVTFASCADVIWVAGNGVPDVSAPG